MVYFGAAGSMSRGIDKVLSRLANTAVAWAIR